VVTLAEEIKKERGVGFLTLGFCLLFVVSVCEQMSFVSIRTIITPYAKNELLIAASLLGLLTGVLSIASMFASTFSAKILSIAKHKYILIVGLLLEGLAVLCYLFVKSFPSMVVVRMLHGFLFGITQTTAIAMVGNSIRREMMGRGLGVFGFANMAGLGVAPPVSKWIYGEYGVTTLFLFAGACILISVIVAIFTPHPKFYTAPEKTETKERFSLKRYLLPSALPSSLRNLFIQFSYAAVQTFIIVYGDERGWAQVGLFYTVYAVGSLIVRPIMGSLYDKRGIQIPFYVTTISFIASLIILALAKSFTVFLLSAVLMTVGFGGGWCVFQADALRCKNPKDRGSASATYFLIREAGVFLGSTIAGYVSAAVGYSSTFLLYTIPPVISLVVFAVQQLVAKSRPAPSEKPETQTP